MILFIKNHIIWFPSVQHCNWFGFRISLSREGAIFRDEIENYFSCSRLARRDRDYHMTILVFRDENEIPFCYSHVSRRDRDFRKSFLVVEREKMKLTLVENPQDREFSLTSELCSFQWWGTASVYSMKTMIWTIAMQSLKVVWSLSVSISCASKFRFPLAIEFQFLDSGKLIVSGYLCHNLTLYFLLFQTGK